MASDKSEIDQIMNEIEELQNEMASKSGSAFDEPAAPTSEETDIVHEAESTPVVASEDRSLGEFVTVEPQVETTDSMAPTEAPLSGPSGGGRVSLGVSDGVAVCLKHESSESEITIEFDGPHLKITASNGAEIRLPLVGASHSSGAVPRLKRVA